MSVAELLRECRDSGITLWREGETLGYRCEPDVMTDGLLADLAEHKPIIMAVLAILEELDRSHEHGEGRAAILPFRRPGL